MDKPSSVEEYLATLPDDQRAALERLRATIRAAAPEATEAISYQMPAFKDHGRSLVCYAAFKDHYSLFPMSTRVIDAHREELGRHVTGKGTIAFRFDEPFPTALVRKLVKARLQENATRRRR